MFEINNCWSVTAEGRSITFLKATYGRPIDWANPAWNYVLTVMEEGGEIMSRIHNVHCWISEKAMKDTRLASFLNHLQGYVGADYPARYSGTMFLHADDLWEDEWGEKPPIFNEPLAKQIEEKYYAPKPD